MSRGSLVGARESKSSCDTSQASTLASMTADVEACILCRAAPPGDGDRCEANRKPVPDEPDEAAMVTAQAAEKALSSASSTSVLPVAGAPSGGVRSGLGMRLSEGTDALRAVRSRALESERLLAPVGTAKAARTA